METNINYWDSPNDRRKFGNFYCNLMGYLTRKEETKVEDDYCPFCDNEPCKCVEINNAVDLERDNLLL
jgi:hypothetical protein